MAVKITRQASKIALLGAPVSAGAHAPGPERAPLALRQAGLVERLMAAGFEVTDMGDIPQHAFAVDDESPRARNIRSVVAANLALKPHVELAVKSGALPVILGGDCTIALGVIASVKRYFPHVGLLYCDGHADLNTPATSPSGFLEGMVVAHIAGKGSPELVRITTDPPLVREPDITLFGTARLDPGEEKFLAQSPMRKYAADEIAAAEPGVLARRALERLQGGSKQIILHFNVDMIASSDFPASSFGAPGGLSLEHTRAALAVFCAATNLAAVIVTEYIPEKDPGGSAARQLMELLAVALAARLPAATQVPAQAPAEAAPALEPAAAEAPTNAASQAAAPVEPAGAEEQSQAGAQAEVAS